MIMKSPNGYTTDDLYEEVNSGIEPSGAANDGPQSIQTRYFVKHRRGKFTAIFRKQRQIRRFPTRMNE